MSPAAVTIGAATLSRSRLRLAQNAATATVSTPTTIDEMIAPITEITMKSTTEMAGVLTSADDTTLASTASTAEIESDEHDRRADVLAEHGVDPPGEPERSGVDLRAEPAAERAEDVAAHPDRGRDEDEQAGKCGEGAGDRCRA